MRLPIFVLLAIAACSQASGLIISIDPNSGNLIGSIIVVSDANAFPGGDIGAVIGIGGAGEIALIDPNIALLPFDPNFPGGIGVIIIGGGGGSIPIDLNNIIIGTPIFVQSLEITGPADINDSETVTFGANFIYNDGYTSAITRNITWSVDDPNIATIDSNGVLRPTLLFEKTVQVTISAACPDPLTIVLPFNPGYEVPVHTNTFTVTIRSSLTDQQLAQKNLKCALRLQHEILSRSVQARLHLLRAAAFGGSSKDYSRSLRSLFLSYSAFANDFSKCSGLLSQTDNIWSGLLPPAPADVCQPALAIGAAGADQPAEFKLEILGPDRFPDLTMFQFNALATYPYGTSVDVTNLVTWTSSNTEIAEPNVDGFFYLKPLETRGKSRVTLFATYSENGVTAVASHQLEIISHSSPEELALWNLIHANQIEFEILPLLDELAAAGQRALEYSVEVPAGVNPRLWNSSRLKLSSAIALATQARQNFIEESIALGEVLEDMFDTITFTQPTLPQKKWYRPHNPALP